MAAEGFGGEIVAGHGIGPGPAAAADIEVFAVAATAFICFEVAHFLEERRVFPDILEALLADIASSLGEIATGQDIAIHINQADELSGKAAL